MRPFLHGKENHDWAKVCRRARKGRDWPGKCLLQRGKDVETNCDLPEPWSELSAKTLKTGSSPVNCVS